MLWVIWITAGASVGLISGGLMKGGMIDRFARVLICTAGAIAIGWLAAFFQFMPGSLYVGAAVGGVSGAVAALVARFVYEIT